MILHTQFNRNQAETIYVLADVGFSWNLGARLLCSVLHLNRRALGFLGTK